jgi:hypothetical protein
MIIELENLNLEYKGKLNYDRWGAIDKECWNVIQID